jgi:hypothetical protein
MSPFSGTIIEEMNDRVEATVGVGMKKANAMSSIVESRRK